MTEQELMSALEAIIYAADEPATLDQIVAAITGEKLHSREAHREARAEVPVEVDAESHKEAGAESGESRGEMAADAAPETRGELRSDSQAESRAKIRTEIRAALDKLVASYAADERGIEIRKVAGGWKMYTKAQHHEIVRRFIKGLRPPLRLTMPALETLSVIAYKQPVTLPEINEVRGVNCGGVVKTLLERRLITTAGRKEAVGRPILYRTSKDFLMRFGLADLDELPSLKEFEQLAQAALGADDGVAPIEPDETSAESPQESLEERSAVLTAGDSSPAESRPNNSSPAESRESADASSEISAHDDASASPEKKAATSHG
jgi:segregation and condensation protein B